MRLIAGKTIGYQYFRVFLDGADVSDLCAEVDEERGYVVLTTIPLRIVPNPTGIVLYRQTVRGNVRVDLIPETDGHVSPIARRLRYVSLGRHA